MLELLQKYALKWAAARKPVFYLILVLLVLLGGTLLFSGSRTGDILMIPAILLFVWFLLLFSFLNLFAHVPERKQRGGLFARLLLFLKRGFYYIFALAMLGLTLAVLVTTYQMLMAWLYEYFV